MNVAQIQVSTLKLSAPFNSGIVRCYFSHVSSSPPSLYRFRTLLMYYTFAILFFLLFSLFCCYKFRKGSIGKEQGFLKGYFVQNLTRNISKLYIVLYTQIPSGSETTFTWKRSVKLKCVLCNWWLGLPNNVAYFLWGVVALTLLHYVLLLWLIQK